MTKQLFSFLRGCTIFHSTRSVIVLFNAFNKVSRLLCTCVPVFYWNTKPRIRLIKFSTQPARKDNTKLQLHDTE